MDDDDADQLANAAKSELEKQKLLDEMSKKLSADDINSLMKQ